MSHSLAFAHVNRRVLLDKKYSGDSLQSWIMIFYIINVALFYLVCIWIMIASHNKVRLANRKTNEQMLIFIDWHIIWISLGPSHLNILLINKWRSVPVPNKSGETEIIDKTALSLSIYYFDTLLLGSCNLFRNIISFTSFYDVNVSFIGILIHCFESWFSAFAKCLKLRF